MMFPPSYAMDATAASGGPSTVLPQIVTGSPQTILSHVEELLQKAQQFSSLIDEFKKAEQQLSQVWSGHAADSAVKKIESSLSSFTEIVNVINRGAQLLQSSATMITTAQTGYSSVVGSVNPTVAGLMSNPYTYSAAVALSTSASGALKGFITAVGALLKTLGAVNLASELTAVGQIITELEQLFNNKGTGATTGTGSTAGGTAAGSTVTGTGSPVTAPVAPTSVASAAGLAGLANPTSTAPAAAAAASAAPTSLQTGEQGLLHTPDGKLYTADGQPLLNANGSPAYQNYQPAALSGLPNSAGVAANGAPVGGVPASVPAAGAGLGTAGLGSTGLSTAGLGVPQAGTSGAGALAGQPSGTDSWIAVDPSQHAAAGMPSTTVPTTPTTTVPTATVPTDSGLAAGSIGHPGIGEEITVTTAHDGMTTTVEVPMDGHTEVTVNAEGTVTVG